MKKCKGCGGEFRKGTIAFLLVKGKLAGARLCPKCVADGVTIVAPRPRNVAASAIAKTRSRDDDVAKVLRMLRTYAKAAHSAANGETRGCPEYCAHEGRAEGLESAIETIKQELCS
jgi:hypothetical protein